MRKRNKSNTPKDHRLTPTEAKNAIGIGPHYKLHCDLCNVTGYIQNISTGGCRWTKEIYGIVVEGKVIPVCKGCGMLLSGEPCEM